MLIVPLAVALAVQAAPAPSPAPPESSVRAADPATIAEAVRLLDAEGFEQELLRSASTATEMMVASMASSLQKQTGQPLPEDFLKELRQIFLDHSASILRTKMADLKQQAAAIYAQEFTREELFRLRQLSSDPVMVKARQRRKVIDPKLMALGVQTMRAAQPELDAKLERFVSDYFARKSRGADQS